MSDLFQPFQLGPITLANRVVMAPLTRSRAEAGNVPGPLTVEYYTQRATMGLIIAEATQVSATAQGYPNTPGLHTAEQVAGWRKVTDAVHAQGGKIFVQLWHVGRMSHTAYQPDGQAPVAPSAIAAKAKTFVPGQGMVDCSTPRALETAEIAGVVNDFRTAARNAIDAGFDGVEIHGAHGYLVDQFFWEGSNQRTDGYGGSLANRSRFAIELIKAVRAAVGPDFPIILRFSQWKQQDYSARLVLTPEALGDFLQPLSDAGVDIFHCSTRRFWEPEFDGSDLNLAGWTRKLTGKPTITVGSVGLDGEFLQFMVNTDKVAKPADLGALLTRLNNQEFDLVAVGRALLVDPEWAVKVRDGHQEDILPFSREALMSLV